MSGGRPPRTPPRLSLDYPPPIKYRYYVTNYPHVGHSSPVAVLLDAAVLRDYVLQAQREGQSLAAIGRTLGVSHAAVSQWLAGKRQPSKTVLLLAHLLSQQNSGTWPM